MDLEEAKKSGAMALFGEKYDSKVRVVSMGDFSCELCGGTHVSRTGDIGFFKIMSDSGIAAGVRRIEACTNAKALEFVQNLAKELSNSASLLKSELFGVASKVENSLEHNKALEREVNALKEKLALSSVNSMINSAEDVNGVKVLISKLDNVEVKEMRVVLDDMKNRLGKCVVLLGSVVDSKVVLIAGVSKDMTSQIKAGELVNVAAQVVGGKGGGRPDMAQAGGTKVEELSNAIAQAKQWVAEKLK
jgi:alanyl-tRNA synthetase